MDTWKAEPCKKVDWERRFRSAPIAVATKAVGFVMASSFPAILVYAQELAPGRVGMIAGLFFGFAFGMGGLGAAVLGLLADKTSIEYVYQLTAFLPLLGIVAAWLPPSRPAAH